MRSLVPTLATLLLVCTASCRSFFGLEPASERRTVEAGAAIAEAQIRLDADDPETAVKLLLGIKRRDRLDTLVRHRIELLLERGAFEWLDRLEASGADSDELVDLYEKKLPNRARVAAGIAAARRMVAEENLLEAYRTVKRVDEAFPTHYERAAAGEVLVDAGFGLAESDETYFWFFDYRDHATEVLEYLVLNYPSNRSCEEAYVTLAALYEEDDRLALAQERHEDLLLFYPASPYAAFSEAKIPALRMRRVRGPRYDRSELDRARGELEAWLVHHEGDEHYPDVQRELVDCKRLIVQSDLVQARFYDRIGEEFGVRLHAGRALELARDVADPELVTRSAAMLERVGVEDLP